MESEPPTVSGKPVHLAEIFTDADFDRIDAALKTTRSLYDDLSATCAPAGVYGAWLDAIGLLDLATRARTELPDASYLGDQLNDMFEQFQGRGRGR
jgi:hypothetical protein